MQQKKVKKIVNFDLQKKQTACRIFFPSTNVLIADIVSSLVEF